MQSRCSASNCLDVVNNVISCIYELTDKKMGGAQRFLLNNTAEVPISQARPELVRTYLSLPEGNMIM